MNWCYGVCHNYGLAIVLFTFLTKIILLPLSLWTYFNGITMIKIQPDINFIKVKYYGQQDQIAEEQAKLFKEKKYSPLASTVPTLAQLFLLMGVVGVIKLGINNPAIDMHFGPIHLGEVPSEVGVRLLWSPAVAGIAAFILCIAQNASSVLQAEQSKLNKYGMTIFSVALSLYLGWFVAVGTAFYWVCSNLFAVLQLYICNWIVKPRRYVDYERLEDSRKQLDAIHEVGKSKKGSYFSTIRRREREDYKRFFSIVNKHLVFYSEGNGYYKYFREIIEYILEHSNIVIHYITSDPNDKIFEKALSEQNIRPYYIGENKLITLMMKMDADIVAMTMPDLNNYHIKRSYIRNDIEYIYIPHGMTSLNLCSRTGSLDHFDTFFCSGPHHVEESNRIEHLRGTKVKNKVEYGFCLLDSMRKAYLQEKHIINSKKKVLIAPSWQPDNIVDSCLDAILYKLKDTDYDIIVRPHPQEVRLKREYMNTLKAKYERFGVEIQTDYSSENSVMEADVLITDWSGIAWEYSFTTYRPVLFINTPIKVMNPDYKKIDIQPVDVSYRTKIGKELDVEDIDSIVNTVGELLENADSYYSSIKELAESTIFNLDSSAEKGGKYIIKRVQEYSRSRKDVKDNK